MTQLARLICPIAPLAVRATFCALIGYAVPGLADAGLQASYGIAPRSTGSVMPPVVRDSATNAAPLRLEYELTTRVEHMVQTTRQLRSIVERMPGPNLPSVDVPPPLPAHYASLYAETLIRLAHVEQLIADITHIIQAMPAADHLPLESNSAADIPILPDAKSQPAPTEVQSQPLHELPKPSPAPDSPVPNPTVRAISLAIGGLIAALLAMHLRRMFLRSRPSRKELAAAIETPSLNDDVLELADVMSSMGFTEGATQALIDRIQSNPRQALTHWLKLLAVYRHTGKKSEFEKAAAETHAAFNVKPGSWEDNDADREASLEDHPHIITQLKGLWPTPECGEYLLSLLADNRDGKRTGFPLPTVEEIVLLLAILADGETPQAV